MLKSKWNTVKKWTAENKEVITKMAIGTAVVVGTAVIVSSKRKGTKQVLELDDKGEDKVKLVFKDRFLWQLYDQDEAWCLFTTDINNVGEPTDLVEIARQIAEGAYREE